MRIKSVQADHHVILGSTKINFFGDSEVLHDLLFKKGGADLLVELEPTDEKNYFTYIIGQNGVGKTLLFKSIIYYANLNSPKIGGSLEAMIHLYNRSGKYRRWFSLDSGYDELRRLGIYNTRFRDRAVREPDFLAHYDLQMIYISSVFDETLASRNTRFRSFNYLSEINKTKILFARALGRFYGTTYLTALNAMLNFKPDAAWTMEAGLSYDAAGGISQNVSTVLLSNENGINIVNFISLMDKITINVDGSVDEKQFTQEDVRVFEAIYHSSAFFKLVHDSGIPMEQVFSNISNGVVLNRIKNFLSNTVDSVNLPQSLNVRLTKGTDWNFLVTNPSALNEFDILLLGLLERLHLVAIDIKCNDVPVEKLSSGEQSLIRLFSFFADLPIDNKHENLIVFFDEPENSLHPRWQQDFPHYFRQIVEDVYKIKSSHFIFATHSPLIIMRAAQVKHSNVLRFYKDENKIFNSQQINNINSFSIEEVLLDEFKISYRNGEVESDVTSLLKSKHDTVLNNQDPIHAVSSSFELRQKIDDLFKRSNNQP